jgi:hypothetical protein
MIPPRDEPELRARLSRLAGQPLGAIAAAQGIPVSCARLARRVKYAPHRMDLCGRLADDGGDVTEGHLKRLRGRCVARPRRV